MRIKVIYLVDQTTKVDEFRCTNVSRQVLSKQRGALLEFVDGVDSKQHKVLTVQYMRPEVIYTYGD